MWFNLIVNPQCNDGSLGALVERRRKNMRTPPHTFSSLPCFSKHLCFWKEAKKVLDLTLKCVFTDWALREPRLLTGWNCPHMSLSLSLIISSIIMTSVKRRHGGTAITIIITITITTKGDSLAYLDMVEQAGREEERRERERALIEEGRWPMRSGCSWWCSSRRPWWWCW